MDERTRVTITMDDEMLSLAEAAATMHVHVETVRRAIWRGDLASVRIGRCVRVLASDLRSYVQARRSQKPAPVSSRRPW